MEQSFMEFIKQGQTTLSNMVLHQYSQLGLTNEEFILFIQISSSLQAGNDFPDLELIAGRMGIKTTEVYDLVHQLLAKKMLTIVPVSEDDGKKHDRYSFELLYRKLAVLTEKSQQKVTEKDAAFEKEQVYNQIEEEFGHPLSPIEMETIDAWLKKDQYSPELITAALREAVLSRAYSLKYMDKILLSWEKQNIKSAADVENFQNKRRQSFAATNKQSAKSKGRANQVKIPLYKWSGQSDKPR